MARPVWFEWDDHDWSESPRPHRLKEQRTHPSTVHRDGNIAAGASEIG
jgi:putative transposase